VSEYGAYGVDAERKEHGAIKSGKKELGTVPGAIGAANARVDGQRLFKGPGSGGMGVTSRTMAGSGASVNRAKAGSFKIRKRSVK
jgi:hypothetical protein